MFTLFYFQIKLTLCESIHLFGHESLPFNIPALVKSPFYILWILKYLAMEQMQILHVSFNYSRKYCLLFLINSRTKRKQ